MQGLLGVLKEIRSALDQGPAVHPVSELPKLFSSQPFTVPAVQLSDHPVKTDSLGIDVDMDIGKLPDCWPALILELCNILSLLFLK